MRNVSSDGSFQIVILAQLALQEGLVTHVAQVILVVVVVLVTPALQLTTILILVLHWFVLFALVLCLTVNLAQLVLYV